MPQKRKLQANITDEHRCKNSQQNSSKQNPTTYCKYHTPLSSELYPRDGGLSNVLKPINVIHHINKLKDKINILSQ